MGLLEGVIRTRVGYMGGSSVDPTYHNLGDHTEAVQVDYDPSRVSYSDLLVAFFGSHNCSVGSPARQYRSAIFYHDAEQEALARQAKADLETRSGSQVYTDVEEAGPFYLAEDYHQKYALQGDKLLAREFRAIYPAFEDVVDSTAAAKVNGYLYGYGSREKLLRELDSLGLSEEAREHLLASVY